MSNAKLPSIPEPMGDAEAVRATVSATKQVVEVLAGQRGSKLDRAVTWRELVTLGVIAADQVPS